MLAARLVLTLIACSGFMAAGLSSAARAQAPAPLQAPATPPNEPRVLLNVAEDEQVRIEELRVRGESRRIVVKSKIPGAAEYEIAPATAAVDPSQRGRRPPGTSQWRVLSF